MKLPGVTIHAPRPARREQGMAVIVVMALIVLVLIYLMGNARTFYALGREIKLLDRQQTRRLQLSLSVTNAPTAANVNTNSVLKTVRPEPSSQTN
jgi:hypothetical protein